MLESAEAGQLDEWRDFYSDEPFGESWAQTSVITTQIINTLTAIASAQSGQKMTESMTLDVDTFIPTVKSEHGSELSDVDRFARVMRNQIGV